jgi:hypothetical protein
MKKKTEALFEASREVSLERKLITWWYVAIRKQEKTTIY